MPGSSQLFEHGCHHIWSECRTYSSAEANLGTYQWPIHYNVDRLRGDHQPKQEFYQLSTFTGRNISTMCTIHW